VGVRRGPRSGRAGYRRLVKLLREKLGLHGNGTYSASFMARPRFGRFHDEAPIRQVP
jgi:hypothetical protein